MKVRNRLTTDARRSRDDQMVHAAEAVCPCRNCYGPHEMKRDYWECRRRYMHGCPQPQPQPSHILHKGDTCARCGETIIRYGELVEGIDPADIIILEGSDTERVYSMLQSGKWFVGLRVFRNLYHEKFGGAQAIAERRLALLIRAGLVEWKKVKAANAYRRVF